jgi:hypothetical protein
MLTRLFNLDLLGAMIGAPFLFDGGGGSGGGGGNGGGEGGGGSGEGGEGGGSGSGSGSGEGGGSGEGKGEGESETLTVSKKDWDGLQQRNRETAAELKKLTDAQAERERKEAEEKGEHEKIAKQEREAREKAEKEKADTEAELTTERRQNRGHRIAGRLGFKDTGDAIKLLDDPEVLDDDSKAEKALKDLAKSKPHLVTGSGDRKQRDLGGGDGGGTNGADVTGPARLAKAYGAKDGAS